MGFEYIPEKPEPEPVKGDTHLCSPPQRLPNGNAGIPAGTLWRCEGCGSVYVAHLWATWYGVLVMNIWLLFWLPMRFVLIVLGRTGTAWTRRKTFVRVSLLCYVLTLLFGIWVTVSCGQSIYCSY